MYPRLVIDTRKIAENVRVLVGLCAQHGLRVCGVTKAVGAEPHIARVFAENGVFAVGDSRLDDLARITGLAVPRLLIRPPHPAEAERVVRLADVSVNTEVATIRALDEACSKLGGKRHGIMLMADLGDLREGFVSEEELMYTADAVASSRNLTLYGLGANLNCLSFILPDAAKMEQLATLSERLCARIGVTGLEVSGGNSSTIRLMLEEGLPPQVTSLRLGETLLVGRERAGYSYLPGTHDDAFVFQAGIVELKDKPSKPWGTAGADSYGRYHEFEDRGIRRRAIAAFGHQDADADVMWPLDAGVEVVDSSSDHTVLDVTDAQRDYAVGSIVEFKCGYHAIARACTSPYVSRKVI